MFLKSFSGLQARASQLLLFILVAAAAAAAAAATAKSLESCPTLCDPIYSGCSVALRLPASVCSYTWMGKEAMVSAITRTQA